MSEIAYNCWHPDEGWGMAITNDGHVHIRVDGVDHDYTPREITTLRTERDALRATVAGLREALIQICAECGGIDIGVMGSVTRMVNAALAATPAPDGRDALERRILDLVVRKERTTDTAEFAALDGELDAAVFAYVRMPAPDGRRDAEGGA